jgi:hypothetical protein
VTLIYALSSLFAFVLRGARDGAAIDEFRSRRLTAANAVFCWRAPR